MNIVKGLDTETQLLVALGSAVAAGCMPCLEKIFDLASSEGIEAKKLQAAAVTGQFVKDQPANQMKELADKLLGTHLNSTFKEAACTMDSEKTETHATVTGNENQSACGCA